MPRQGDLIYQAGVKPAVCGLFSLTMLLSSNGEP